MIHARITDPETVSAREVQAILDQGLLSPTVQFSKPGYAPSLLQAVNSLCADFGEQLEVRFYGHYAEGFDAAVLSQLSEVRWLSVDCLDRICNEDSVWRMPHLKRLSFGVHRFNRPDFLAGLALEQIKHLSLSETATRNFDLSPLKRCQDLTNLFIQGHTKNIDALTTLPKLTSLVLSGMPKRLKLSFVKEISGLRSLTILLGGRTSMDEIGHDQLEELRIVWVRGLETLGSLNRFPALRVLHVEDQLQLRTISVVGAPLRELSIHNCKNLEEIAGLETLTGLQHFRVSRTKLDMDALLAREWPPSMDVLALYSNSEKWNKQARAILDSRGYGEFSAKSSK